MGSENRIAKMALSMEWLESWINADPDKCPDDAEVVSVWQDGEDHASGRVWVAIKSKSAKFPKAHPGSPLPVAHYTDWEQPDV